MAFSYSLHIKFDYNKFTKEIIDAKIKEKTLLDKSDISKLEKMFDLNTKLVTLATKVEYNINNKSRKAVKDKIVKLQAFDSNYFCRKSYFEDDGTQSYLVFQSISRYFKTVANTLKLQRGNQKCYLMRVLNLH